MFVIELLHQNLKSVSFRFSEMGWNQQLPSLKLTGRPSKKAFPKVAK